MSIKATGADGVKIAVHRKGRARLGLILAAAQWRRYLLMKKRYLFAIVFCIRWLRYLRILPNVWYQSEFTLAEIRGKELADFFNSHSADNKRH